MLLGDMIHKALSTVGVTQERVHHWLGPNCGCKERQEKLNSLHLWARRIAQGKLANAKEYLQRLMSD